MLTAGSAAAQVNVEPLRRQVEERGFGARVRLSLSSYAGNTEGVIMGASGLIGGRSARHFGYVSASTDYARLDREVSVDKSFAHARYNYEIARWLWWEEYAQVETDLFRRVRFRALAGTGPRFALLQAEVAELYVGTSYMYEYTQHVSDSQSPRGEGGARRLSNYLAGTLRLDPRILLSSVGYWQPRFGRISDYHLLSISSAEFKVTDILQSRLDCTVRYERVTPIDVKPLDFELKSSLELVF